MEFETYNFRNAEAVLTGRRSWEELTEVIAGISLQEIVETQVQLAQRGRLPKGGQTALNEVFRRHLTPTSPPVRRRRTTSGSPRPFEDFQDPATGWRGQVPLFDEWTDELRAWTMDFVKDRVGVEVSFNHAEAIPWTFTRVDLASEAEAVREPAKIDVGVVICAERSLKSWSRMDGAVGTFDLARAWLNLMRPIIPLPIMLIGLSAEGWSAVGTDTFPGTKKSPKRRWAAESQSMDDASGSETSADS